MILLTLLNFVKAYRARFNTEATVLFVTAAEAEELNGAAEMLLRGAVGCRIVLANCDKCGGTGLVPL
jgi:hypothetical protein